MKILLVNKFFYKKGGAETVYFQERDMLKQAGFDIVEFSMTHEKNEDSEFSDYFVDNVDYHKTAGLIAKFHTAKNFVHNSLACQKFEALLEAERPDIVHFHNIYHQLTPSLISVAKQAGAITVLTAHDYKIACPNYTLYREGEVCEKCVSGSSWNAFKYRCHQGSLTNSFLLSLEAWFHSWKKSYQALDAVVAPSAFLAEFIQRKLPNVKTEVIVNGIDEQLATGAIQDDGYFVYVGRLSHEKGVPTLLEAHQQLNRRIPLKIVGTGPMYETLSSQYPEAEFCGYQSGDALNDLIKKARAVIVPSEWYENCSMSVLEAMAYGKPVIGAEIGGIPEQVRHQQEGLLFEAGNQQALSDALTYMIENPNEAQQMGLNARQRLIDKYSLSKHKSNLLGLYERLVKK